MGKPYRYPPPKRRPPEPPALSVAQREALITKLAAADKAFVAGHNVSLSEKRVRSIVRETAENLLHTPFRRGRG